MDWKFKPGEASQSFSQMVDGIIFNREGAVPALIFHFKLVAEVDLFSGLDWVGRVYSVLDLSAACVRVDAESGINQRPMSFKQPFHAVIGSGLFIGGQRENEVTLWYKAFSL